MNNRFPVVVAHLCAQASFLAHQTNCRWFVPAFDGTLFIMIPNSLATSVCMRPLVSHSAPASRLDSSVNRRFVAFVIKTPPRSAEPIIGVRQTEGRSKDQSGCCASRERLNEIGRAHV